MLEHAPTLSIRFICDRGVANELTRHRIGVTFHQESTRYCNYANGLTFIMPVFWGSKDKLYYAWACSMAEAEKSYISLINQGATPEQARTVLPLSLKTELIMTANIRAIRNILNLRCANNAHPQMRQIMHMLLDKLYALIPTLIEDIYDQSGNYGFAEFLTERKYEFN